MNISKSQTPAANLICTAIRQRSVLAFQYRGLHRVVEPYCHGISTRGAEVLRAVQIAGDSSSGGFGFGKLWTVSAMAGLHITDQSFVADDPDYNPDDSGMKEIHCRV